MVVASRLYDQFAFDFPTSDPDEYGAVVYGWTELIVCRGDLKNLRGRESVIAARLQGVQPVVITVRASDLMATVTPGWRIRDLRTGVQYNIRSIVRSDDRRSYEITAESGVPQ